MVPDNLFAATSPVADEVTDLLVRHEGVRVERIVSRGHRSPVGFWYDQDEHEWVAVLRGQARLLFEGPRGEVTLGPGDHVVIAPHERHRVEWTDPEAETVWLAVFYSGSPEDSSQPG